MKELLEIAKVDLQSAIDFALKNQIDVDDNCSLVLGIKPGAGGKEAAGFAVELMEMYSNFCRFMRWNCKLSEQEMLLEIDGKFAHKLLRMEAGVNRVQRVPANDKSGRVHTSTVGVFVIPVFPSNEVQIRKSDLRIDTFRASGKGGQHVNRTDSAVRVVHLPTGLCVSCQQERSQIANRKLALEQLREKLREQNQKILNVKNRMSVLSQISCLDRNSKQRTYNFKADRIQDSRCEKTFYGIERFLKGRDELYGMVSLIYGEYIRKMMKE